MKTTASILFCMVCVVASAQSRVNRPKITWVTESDSIVSAVGWAYNKTLGEWVDYPNFISPNKDYKDKYHTLLNSSDGYVQSHSSNVLKLQVKSLVIDNKITYALLVTRWEGRYKYPSIQRDWYTWRQIDAYLFSAAEYLNFRKFYDVIFNQMTSQGNAYDEIDEQKLLDIILTESQRDKRIQSQYLFKIKPLEDAGNQVVRFLLPERNSKIFQSDFETRYFEVPRKEFEKLFID